MEEARSTGRIGGMRCDVGVDVSLLKDWFCLVSVGIGAVVLSVCGMMFGHADCVGLS